MIAISLRLSIFCVLLLFATFLVWPKTFLVGEATSFAQAIRFVPLADQNFFLDPPGPLEKLERIEIPVHPNSGPSHLEILDMEITPDCSFSLANPVDVSDKVEILLWPQGPGCSDVVPGHFYSGRLRTKSTVPLWVPVSKDIQSNLNILHHGASWSLGILWVAKKGVASRLEALAAMWDSPIWILLIGLLVSVVPAGIGLRLLGNSQNRTRPFITGLMALTSTLLIALVTPPFQAPDENNHFYAYAKLNNNSKLLYSGMELGEKGHFARIRSKRSEIYTPEDARSTSKKPMLMQDSHNISERSALVSMYWQLLDQIIPSSKANITLWGIRWFNGIFFGFSVFFGAWLLQYSAPQLRCPIFLFIVPSLPFFAMHLSNHAFTPSLSVIAACLAMGLLYKRGNWSESGVILGLICAIALLTSRSMIGLAIGIVFLILPVPVLAAMRSRREAILFWGGFFAGLTPLFVAWSHPQVENLIMVGHGVLEQFFPAIATILKPLINPVGIAVIVIMAYCCERCFNRIFTSYKEPDWTFLCWAIAPLVALFGNIILIGITYNNLPGFPNIELRTTFPLDQYFSKSIFNFFTGFSPRKPTFLLQSTFWGGFSWLEALLPHFVIRLLGTLSGIGMILFCLSIWKRRDGKQTIMLYSLILTVIIVLLATTFGAYSTKMNLHGRYILSVYLLFLAPAFASYIPNENYKSTIRIYISLGIWFLPFIAISGQLLLLERFFGCDTLYTLLGHRLG